MSLHSAGWRQGSFVAAALPLIGMIHSLRNKVVRHASMHDLWLVVTQDCDLDGTDETEKETTIELRPVFDHDPPSMQGIRSRRLLLENRRYLDAQSRRVMVSAAALTAIRRLTPGPLWTLSTERIPSLKTWLGLRYDRPAVPPQHVRLAKALATEIMHSKHRDITRRVREVLVQFGDQQPTRYALYAVTLNESDNIAVRRWLGEIAVAVTLGIADGLEVATARNMPLAVVEESYAVDTTQQTWGTGIPDGAYRTVGL